MNDQEKLEAELEKAEEEGNRERAAELRQALADLKSGGTGNGPPPEDGDD